MTDWSSGDLERTWADEVRAGAAAAADPDRLRDVRIRILTDDGEHATAVAEAIHFERRASRFLGIFPGTELVQVADERILVLELEARPVELPGGGQIGAVRWELVSARS